MRKLYKIAQVTAETATTVQRLLAHHQLVAGGCALQAAEIYTDDVVAWTAGQPEAHGPAAADQLVSSVVSRATAWRVTATVVGDDNAVVELLGTTAAGPTAPLTAVIGLAAARVRTLRLYRDPAEFGG